MSDEPARMPESQRVSVEEALALTMAANTSGTLAMWVVTDNPTDFPGQVVARLHVNVAGRTTPTRYALHRDSLDAMTADLDRLSLTKIAASAWDDPVIVGTWV